MGKLLFDEVTYQSLAQGKKTLFLFQWLHRLPETIRQFEKVCFHFKIRFYKFALCSINLVKKAQIMHRVKRSRLKPG